MCARRDGSKAIEMTSIVRAVDPFSSAFSADEDGFPVSLSSGELEGWAGLLFTGW